VLHDKTNVVKSIMFQIFFQVLSMTMDLFVAKMMITKTSLVFRGPIEITESQVSLIGTCYE
jgi:hypothetical protein